MKNSNFCRLFTEWYQLLTEELVLVWNLVFPYCFLMVWFKCNKIQVDTDISVSTCIHIPCFITSYLCHALFLQDWYHRLCFVYMCIKMKVSICYLLYIVIKTEFPNNCQKAFTFFKDTKCPPKLLTK